MARQFFPLRNPDMYPVFEGVVAGMPSTCEPYLYGGAVRSAVYEAFHGEPMSYRDYDQILIQGSAEYVEFLKSRDFKNGRIPSRPEEHVILRRPLVPNTDPEDFDDSAVFDIHKADGNSAIDYMTHNVGIAVGGIALPLRKLFDADWLDSLTALPSALDDIRNKQISINPHGYLSQPANLFACLRLMSKGFAPPPESELKQIVDQLADLTPRQITRNIRKLSNSPEGDANIRAIASSVGIKGDILSIEEVTSGLVRL